MKCKVCGSDSAPLFTKLILRKYKVGYFRCVACAFMQTEEPYWLAEAYASPLARCDIGLVARPLANAVLTRNVILNHFDPRADFMDFGGGTGLFTRHMRDNGLRFFHYDKYVDNLFAPFFGVADRVGDAKVELITAFEVFEHFEDPLAGIEEIFGFGDSIFFSTVLQPADVTALRDWDYLSELSGQHVSFYSARSLKVIAERFGCESHSDGNGLHLLTRRKLGRFSVRRGWIQKFAGLLQGSTRVGHARAAPLPKSLTAQDLDYVLARLSAGPSDESASGEH
jgi:hypothetical protein